MTSSHDGVDCRELGQVGDHGVELAADLPVLPGLQQLCDALELGDRRAAEQVAAVRGIQGAQARDEAGDRGDVVRPDARAAAGRCLARLRSGRGVVTPFT